MKPVDDRPRSATAALALIFLNSLIWLAFGAIIALNLHPALPDSPLLKGIMASLSFGVTGILLALAFLLGKRNRAAYFLTLGLLFVIALLTVFDEFGWADLLVLAVNIAPMILLILERAWYLQSTPNTLEQE